MRRPPAHPSGARRWTVNVLWTLAWVVIYFTCQGLFGSAVGLMAAVLVGLGGVVVAVRTERAQDVGEER